MLDRVRILFIDDNESHLATWRAYLSDLDCDTDAVRESATVLGRVTEFKPHVIILDPSIPDGHDICRRIKKNPPTRNTMVLMISSLNELGDVERAVEAGTDDFVPTPVSKFELVKRVENLLQFRSL